MNTSIKIFSYVMLGICTVASVSYAAGVRITTLTQTATTWDKITPEWVNAVNTKLNTATAAWWNVSCAQPQGGMMICIWSDGTCRMTGNASIWSSCTNALQ